MAAAALDENARLIRLRECTKLLAFLHQYATHHDAAGLPVVMCTAWDCAIQELAKQLFLFRLFGFKKNYQWRWAEFKWRAGKLVECPTSWAKRGNMIIPI